LLGIVVVLEVQKSRPIIPDNSVKVAIPLELVSDFVERGLFHSGEQQRKNHTLVISLLPTYHVHVESLVQICPDVIHGLVPIDKIDAVDIHDHMKIIINYNLIPFDNDSRIFVFRVLNAPHLDGAAYSIQMSVLAILDTE